jgi:hypothetical protein
MSKQRIYASIILSIILALSYLIPYFAIIAAAIIIFIFSYSEKGEENNYR